jgi:hypothetical protein
MDAQGVQEERKHPFREPATSKLESPEMRQPRRSSIDCKTKQNNFYQISAHA